MPEMTIQGPQAQEPTIEDPDTDAEFKALYTDAIEGRDRFAALAKAADEAGKPDVANIYREIGGTVMTLFMDVAAASGNALVNIEDQIDGLPAGGATGGSGLLPEDAEKFLQLFDQYMRLLDGLTALVPAGSDGDAQREVFATLRRMTEGMVEYTKSIVLDEDPEDDDPEEDEDPEDDA
jgi:hypothetical protein